MVNADNDHLLIEPTNGVNFDVFGIHSRFNGNFAETLLSLDTPGGEIKAVEHIIRCVEESVGQEVEALGAVPVGGEGVNHSHYNIDLFYK